MPFKVIVNRCVGDACEDPTVSCGLCDKPGSVVMIKECPVCGMCLNLASVAIRRAVLKKAGLNSWEE